MPEEHLCNALRERVAIGENRGMKFCLRYESRSEVPHDSCNTCQFNPDANGLRSAIFRETQRVYAVSA